MTENAESLYTILEHEYAQQKPEALLSFEDALALAIPVVFSFGEDYVVTEDDIVNLVQAQSGLGLLNMYREALGLEVEQEADKGRIFLPYDDIQLENTDPVDSEDSFYTSLDF